MHIDPDVKRKFPEICIAVAQLGGVRIRPAEERISRLSAEVLEFLKAEYELEGLSKYPNMEAYRKFMWKVGIDPTKTRPSAEALIRRALQGPLPRINTLVDLENLVSAKHAISLSAYDYSKVDGKLVVRFAERGEKFEGIGGKSMSLRGDEVVLSDSERILCIYPYRDAEETKITESAEDIIIVGYGVPGIEKKSVVNCVEEFIKEVQGECGGKLLGMVAVD